MAPLRGLGEQPPRFAAKNTNWKCPWPHASKVSRYYSRLSSLVLQRPAVSGPASCPASRRCARRRPRWLAATSALLALIPPFAPFRTHHPPFEPPVRRVRSGCRERVKPLQLCQKAAPLTKHAKHQTLKPWQSPSSPFLRELTNDIIVQKRKPVSAAL